MTETALDPYAVLGVSRDATPAQIKAAFRLLSKTRHPDAGGTAAAFAELKRCHLVLADPDSRARYDRTGEMVPDKADNDQAQAWGMINAMLQSINMGDREPDMALDFVDIMVRHLLKDIKGAKDTKKAGEMAAKRWERFKGRFIRKHKTDTPEGIPFDAIADANIAQLAKKAAGLDEFVRIADLALKILHDWDFKRDAPAPDPFLNAAFGYRPMGGGTTTTGW